MTLFLLVWYKAIGICSGIIWELKGCLQPLKPKLPFCLGRAMWYHFDMVCFAKFSLHLGKITGIEWVKQWYQCIYKFWFGPYHISRILSIVSHILSIVE